MQIYGIGTDILDMRRIQKIYNKTYYEKFYYRILSQNERKEYLSLLPKKDQYIFLAKRFSVKEAIVKALGTGWRFGIAFNEIEIKKDTLGKPEIIFLGKTLQIIQNLVRKDFVSFVSWSDEYPYIVAYVIIQTT